MLVFATLAVDEVEIRIWGVDFMIKFVSVE